LSESVIKNLAEQLEHVKLPARLDERGHVKDIVSPVFAPEIGRTHFRFLKKGDTIVIYWLFLFIK